MALPTNPEKSGEYMESDHIRLGFGHIQLLNSTELM